MAGFGVDRGSGASVGVSESDSGLTDLMAAKGDLVAGTGAGTAAVLSIGTDEHRLVCDSAQAVSLKYVADTTNYAIAAKGDLLGGTAADTVAPLTVGADGLFLKADSGETTGMVWSAIQSASTSAAGIAELATQAEMDAGTASKVPTTDLQKISLLTMQTATGSETAFDFTVPAGTRKVTISFRGLSLSGTDNCIIQLGDAGGIEATGYVSSSSLNQDGVANVTQTSTVGFILGGSAATNVMSGHMTLTLHDSSTNAWVSSHSHKLNTTTGGNGGGDKALSAELTTVRITRTGTDTFDAGSVNVSYER